LDNYELKEKFVQSKIAKETYKCKHQAFINKPMRSELKLIHKVLANPNKFSLETPIAHIIKREPDFVTLGDACLEAGGGFAKDIFWWHTEWPTSIKALTLKNLTITRKCKMTQNMVSINLLEFVVEIINYAAITTLLVENPSLIKHDYPILLNWTDNTTAQSWIRKAATRTNKGKALQRILCSIMLNNSIGVKADYIEGVNNTLADAISRVFSSDSNTSSFVNLHQNFPEIKYWKRFLPSQELLSHLYSALLQGQYPGIFQIKNLGHFVQDKVIF
jgi:hypothetical protein